MNDKTPDTTENTGVCEGCGNVHANPFTAEEAQTLRDMFKGAPTMPRRSATTEAQKLEDLLNETLGMTGKAHVIDARDPALTMAALNMLNAALQSLALMEMKRLSIPVPVTLVQSVAVTMVEACEASGMDNPANPFERMEWYTKIGEKLNEIVQSMMDGKTSGLFVAPF
jgi:hypothetical protein